METKPDVSERYLGTMGGVGDINRLVEEVDRRMSTIGFNKIQELDSRTKDTRIIHSLYVWKTETNFTMANAYFSKNSLISKKNEENYSGGIRSQGYVSIYFATPTQIDQIDSQLNEFYLGF
ncbi:hypothetical protein COU62_03545 [Candidatus Pacearchaeota archaeon CG10_big_fil_rev_8_21_14_0_10_35_219]|nr:hypothetical protein [Candidatus Pacearchaeota archaeon]OIO42339.1 MAG: hypothetical protein AUJ63_03630 [Candidatus Pacearchaeota archaeon CG1_02_35_32]PIO07426.1 MAG: hypothetical protein COU62_03545 [Candidatus Pacearchaeota archaeon CG10_big_fil_rev_8_21_14_0_10_35_219]PIY81232.1 MAG: hypothetical protein COY79_03040 [Candidatus Pacearchaeota archaeon CG_4_10_14_0_8_um_filter_35_169]PIZ80162.1 MAG: hypothetical protein COY00_01690 [Candidatus Pacearchaeota archaeon CG_4_10_14_0_2_um_filt